MASKQVTDRQKGAAAVAAIADAQGATLGASVGRVLGSDGSQVTALVTQLGRVLLASRDGMVAADAAHESPLRS